MVSARVTRRDGDDFGNRRRLRNRKPILAQAGDVQFNGRADAGTNLFAARARGDAAR